VCTSLDPGFNLWDSVEPYAAKLLRDERGNLANDEAGQAFDAASVALRLPKRLDGLVTRIEDGSLAVATPRLERQVARLIRMAQRVVAALIFGAQLIAGSIVRPNDHVLGKVLMIASVVPLLSGLGAGRRRS
jgi:predicted unusual protein kinase regulating ubiquinone biosynthesis (AarF/ABC1/UbiB family)